MKKQKYCFPLSIQTLLPENYREDKATIENFSLLKELDFDGVELNIAHPENVDMNDVRDFLKEFGLRLTMFASGLTAKTFGLSLSLDDICIRNRAVNKIKEIIYKIENSNTGIILGFFKGPAVEDKEGARSRFIESLKEIAPLAEDKKVAILVEATNRYESSVANSLDDSVELIKDFNDNKYIQILPDTFHMNIEEADTFDVLTKYSSKYTSIHISDNNRFILDLGQLILRKLLISLRKIIIKVELLLKVTLLKISWKTLQSQWNI